MAEWIKATTDTDKEFVVFYDPTTIRKKSGNKVKMWIMYDYQKLQGKAGVRSMSTKVQQEYDCKEEQIRMIYFSTHTKNMGRGEIVLSRSTEKLVGWAPVAPGSINKRVLTIACKK